jgi:putative ABC transport system permease protein
MHEGERSSWRRHLRIWAGDVRADVDEELRFHLDMRTRELIAHGMAPDAARSEAERLFGELPEIRNACVTIDERREKRTHRVEVMDAMMQDLKFALAMLRKNPLFTIVVVLTLALGIGANTAMFSIVNAVLLEPLPYRDPGRLVMIWEHRLDSDDARNVVAPANFVAWREQAKSFESMAAFGERRVIVGTGEGSESLIERMASATLLPMLGVQAVAGRTFTLDEDEPGAPNTAMLSFGLWQRRYGGRADIIGSSIQIGGQPYTVVGVLPRDFRFFEPADVWVTFRFPPETRTTRGRSLHAIARLKPGVTLEEAQREMAALAQRQIEVFPDLETNWTASAFPLQADLVGDVRPALLVLTGAVGFLLLIACANVANLLLARAAAREREIAIRTSLGATPRRLIQQLLTESVLLGVLGGIAGLVIALWGTRTLLSLIPPDIPIARLDTVSIDGKVLAFTMLVAIATGVIFGLVPALPAVRHATHEALKEGGRSNAIGRRGGRLQGALVAAELAFAVVLLAGAGLMLRSFTRLRQVNPGFEPQHALAATIALPTSKYGQESSVIAFYSAAEQRIASLPGVRSVGAINYLPLSGERSASSFHVADRPAPPRGQEPTGDMRAVTPGYFRAMGIPLIAGRFLTDADDDHAPKVAVVSQTLARTFWPKENAIGKHLLYEWDGDQDVEIVGVVGDVHHTGIADEPKMEIYRPLRQFTYWGMTIVIRTTGDPLAFTGAVRSAVREVDRDQPIARLQPLETFVAQALGKSRLDTMLFGTFAGLGLVLAVVGIYGVISYGVSQRTHEIGVRVALGARSGDVLRLIVRRGARLALIGVGIGLVAAFALTRLMRSLLFAVSPSDPMTYAAIIVLLVTVALVASWLPARRAARIDPLAALRQE